ncbi:hypothetical protein MLD38_017161 [Melastoma candidum]|uniref:Uncharacterized protein n=1 Tax=Melastoma candidum TaxID=119954 RepID=A0ACB9QRL8_9MYRT|nr:hypothetical protein MLD38_017161 [Melastoma candidum]
MCSKFLPKTHRPFPLPIPILPPSSWKYSTTLGRSRFGGWCRVVDRDSDTESPEYDVDREKAREALRQLDRQLESFSRKKIPSPKIKASEVKWSRDDEVMSEDASAERMLSDSFLSYAVVGLFLFTVFYNLLFYNVIKPWIDGPEYIPEAQVVVSRAREGTP